MTKAVLAVALVLLAVPATAAAIASRRSLDGVSAGEGRRRSFDWPLVVLALAVALTLGGAAVLLARRDRGAATA
jgi:hypothetical protein